MLRQRWSWLLAAGLFAASPAFGARTALAPLIDDGTVSAAHAGGAARHVGQRAATHGRNR